MKRIALIIVLALVVSVSGCVGNAEKKPDERTSLGAFQNIDKYTLENGSVTCYSIKQGYSGGMSCFLTSEIEGDSE